MDQLELFVDLILHDRYKITSQLGRGGMGAVYEAVDLQRDSKVAIKQMLPVDPNLRLAFKREATILSQITHPGLPQAIDYFETENGLFMAMEFIEGKNLGQLLNNRGVPFAPHQVKRWAEDILQILIFLHTHKPRIIHRDIKPTNLKLTPHGRIVLLDFGLAKQVDETEELITNISILAYTPHYAPIEQIQGESTNAYSDIYALGATLYHLLTGQPPTDALKRANHILCKKEDPLTQITQLAQGLPRSLSSLIMKALSLSPSDRPNSASQMLQQLQAGIITPIFKNPATVFSQPKHLPVQLEATNGLPIVDSPTQTHISTIFTKARPRHLTAVPTKTTNERNPIPISISFPQPPVHLNSPWLTKPPAPDSPINQVQYLLATNSHLYQTNEKLLRHTHRASTLLVLICTAIIATYFYQSNLSPLSRLSIDNTQKLEVQPTAKRTQKSAVQQIQSPVIYINEQLDNEITIEDLIQELLLKQKRLKQKHPRKLDLRRLQPATTFNL